MTTFVPSFDVSDYALSGDAVTRKRWGKSFILILALHASVGVLAVTWQADLIAPLAPPPAIIIDMTPTPPAPTVQPKVEPPKPKEIPVVEKAEVVLKKKKVEPEKPKPKPEKKVEVQPVKQAPAAPKLSAAPIEAKPAVERNYLSVLYAHLQKFKKAPRHFGRMDERVVVKAQIKRDGTLLGVSLTKSSGSDKYDEAALSTLRRADPMPPFPDDMTMSEKTFIIPVVFEDE